MVGVADQVEIVGDAVKLGGASVVPLAKSLLCCASSLNRESSLLLLGVCEVGVCLGGNKLF